MLTEDFVTSTLTSYYTLTARAFEIASLISVPVETDDVISLDFDYYGEGSTVWLLHRDPFDGDDRSIKFPRQYLLMTDEAIIQDLEAKKAALEAKRAALRAAEAAKKAACREKKAAKKEAEERELYQQLKAKFEKDA